MSSPPPTEAEQKLRGGVAVITGAGAGIGAGFARRAAELGMHVYVTDISLERAQSVAKSINDARDSSSERGSAEAMQVDVSKPSELDRLADHVFSHHKSVRLLINNAGIETIGFSWEIPAARWDMTLDINIRGIIHGVRAFVPRMIESGEECWVANLGSLASFAAMPTQTAYILTKHAIEGFSEGLFLEMELKKLPIHVCSVLPGSTNTRIFDAEAGQGEPESSVALRTAMREIFTHAMDVDEGCRIMMAKIAEGKFWAIAQPDEAGPVLARRAEFLTKQSDPELVEDAKRLLGV